MNMKQITPEQRKQKTENIVKIIGMIIAGIIFAPVALFAIGGLVGIAVCAFLSLGIIYMTPVVARKMANWRLKMLKAESTKNPVETLQNEYVKKEAALAEFKEQLRIFTGQVLTFADEVKKYIKDNIDDAQIYVQQLAKLRKLLELRDAKYQQAKEVLKDFAESITITDRKWNMACSASKMNEAAGDMDGDVFDKICIETAMNAVQTKLNMAFADLEISLLDEDKEKAQQLYVEKQRQIENTKTQDIVIDVVSEKMPVSNNRK